MKNFFAILCFLVILPTMAGAQIHLFNNHLYPADQDLTIELSSIVQLTECFNDRVQELRNIAYRTGRTERDRQNLAAFLIRKIMFRHNLSYRENEYLILEAYDLVPRNPVIESTWGDMLLQAGNYQRALERYENAHQELRDDPQILLKAGITARYALEYRKALDYLRQANRLMPNEFNVLFTKGYCYNETRNERNAIYFWEKALEVAQNEQQLQLVNQALGRTMERRASSTGSTRDETQRFSIHYAGSSQRDLGNVTFSLLEEIFFQVSDSLRYFPRQRINVIFYLTEEYYQVHQEWSAAVAQGITIKVPLESGYRGTEYLRGLLAHEFTHTVTNLMTSNRCPLWLDEGLAQYHEFKAAYGSPHTLRPDFRRVYERDFKPVKLTEVASAIRRSGDRDEIIRGYITSYLAVMCLKHHYGTQVFYEILSELGQGYQIDDALKRSIGRNLSEFQTQFDIWLRNRR